MSLMSNMSFKKIDINITHTYIHIHMYICIYMYECMYIIYNKYIFVYIYTYICVCVCVCVFDIYVNFFKAHITQRQIM